LKKSIVLVFVVAAVVVLVSPGIIGRLAERSVDENLQWAAGQDDDIVVTPERFDRHWFSSQGRHRIEIRSPGTRQAIRALLGAGPGDDFPTLVIDTHLDHGLVPFTSIGREHGSLAPGLGRGVSTMSIEFPDGETFPVPGTLYSVIGLDGIVAAEYVVEPGSHQATGVSATWGNADVHVSAHADAQGYRADGTLDSLAVRNEQATLTIGSTTFAADQRPTGFGFAAGELSLNMASVSVDEPGSASVSFGPLAFSGSSALDADRVSGNGTLSVGGVELPGYGATEFDVALRFDGVDGASLGRVLQTLDAVEDGMPAEQFSTLLDADLKQLVAAGFGLDVDRFDVRLPQGAVDSKMRFTVAESEAAKFEWTALLMTLDAAVDLRIASEFVDFAMATNPDAAAVVGMGFLRKNGDVYEVHAEYRKGLLSVNGAPLPLGQGYLR